jgi:hypothetical protein
MASTGIIVRKIPTKSTATSIIGPNVKLFSFLSSFVVNTMESTAISTMMPSWIPLGHFMKPLRNAAATTPSRNRRLILPAIWIFSLGWTSTTSSPGVSRSSLKNLLLS